MLMDMVSAVPPHRPSRIRRVVAARGVRASLFAGAHEALRSLESAVTPADKMQPTWKFVQLIDVADPVEAVYRAGFRTAVMSVPVQSIRWSRIGLRLDDERNPFVALVRAHLSGATTGYAGSALQHHYDDWRPETIGDAWGLTRSDASPGLDQPAASLALPWAAEAGSLDPSDRLRLADKWNRRESAATGAKFGIEQGHKHFGPVSAELGQLEYERYTQLADNVASRGFVPYMDGEYVGVQILTTGEKWVAVVTGPGLHRAVVAAATGVDPLVVAVDKLPAIVHRADVLSWPGVRSGLFSAADARAVFDRFVDGHPPIGFPRSPDD